MNENTKTNLTDWTKEPEYKDMEQAVNAATPTFMEHVSNVETWLSNLNVVSLPQTKKGVAPKSSIVPMLIRKHAEWRYASLSEPLHTSKTLFTVTPITSQDRELAEQDHAILDFQFRNHIPKVKLIDDLVRTAVDEGTVIMQLGWDIKFKKQIEEDDGDEEVEHNKPTVKILSYNDVMIDPNCLGDIKKAKYVIVRKVSTIMELESVGGYSNLDKLQPDSGDTGFGVRNTYISDAFLQKKRNDISIYEYWGYWDKFNKGTLYPVVVTFAQGNILKVEDSPFPFDSLPFVLIQYLPVRKQIYGQPDGFLLTDSQQINGALTRGVIDLLGKSANGQTGYRQNALDPANTLKFMRGEDYIFRADADPREIMYQHTYPEIPNSAITMLQMQQQEAESLTGVNTFGQGVSTNSLGNGSAAAAKGAISYAAKRESGMLRRIATGLEEMAKMIIAMNHYFLTSEFVQRITDKEYVMPSPISDAIDVRVSIRTAEADEASANDLAFLLQTIGNTLDPQFTQLITSKIAKLKGLDDLATEIADFKPQPNPVQEQLQQIQLQSAQLELQIQQAKAALLNSQVATEAMKANKLKAEADKENLEFVEEENGTNHARSLELIEAQARSNMYHTSLKANLEAQLKEKKNAKK